MDPTRWLVRFDPQASRAGLSVRGAANVDGPSLESIVTDLTDHGPEPLGSEGRDGAAGVIVAGLPAFRAVGHRAVPPGNRPVAEDIRDRTWNEAISLAVNYGEIPDAGKSWNAIGERALR